MGIVQMGGNHRICATCAFWDGERDVRQSEVVCNNRDTGLCRGASFPGWRMGAISTCISWERWSRLGLPCCEYDSPPVKNPTT